MPSQQLQTIIQVLRSGPNFVDLSIDEQRAAMDALTSQFRLADDVAHEPVNAGGVPAEWIFTPGADAERVIYYLHGGGYVIGSIKTHREMISRLSRAAGARALAIDYRLAPEHLLPAAVEDSTAAYRWLLSTGVDPARLVIAGDSAGGGLTVATLVALRDTGDPLPAAAVCLSPWVDLEMLGESMTTKADIDPMLQRGIPSRMGEGVPWRREPPRAPRCPPLRRPHGAAPAADPGRKRRDPLDDSARLADRAKAAGVDVTLDVWDDMFHVWQVFASMLPEGQQAIDRIGEFIREHAGAKAAAQ